ncbi:sugar phosphate isomerase/epimerase [Romboutsia maritimum]|uniref:Sugar phosphate isomerase/epimerase n=1 Tax=Romboutsia maritimum TaxID=2020948 RepID=A0A255HZX3_9FIRM|nr:sugar phosphate isomerase/epimerase [Romboutsia maritimum]RDY24103.1 sugar phosphate isomerase/epimerase [Romboutsia maritimum]
MRIGVSTLLFNIKECLVMCEKIDVIKHIEIGIDNIKECSELYEYRDYINKLGLSIGIHLPMELNTCENIEYIKDSWIKYIQELEKNLEGFNIEYFNLHLGYVMKNRLSKNRDKYLNISSEFLDNIKLNKNTVITIENTYSKDGDFCNIGNKVYDFEYIFNKIKNDKTYLCYDTGHYLINKDEYIKNMKDKIKVIHLSDNDGINDIHIGIGKGILSEKHIIEVLKLNPDYLVLEINYEHIKDTIKKLNSIKSTY